MKNSPMSLLTLASAAAMVVLCGPARADDDTEPTVSRAQSSLSAYGRMDLSVESVRAGTKSNVGYGTAGASRHQMSDNTSRLGFRGVEDLGSGQQAVFGIEFGINAPNGSMVSPPMRNAYVGLRGPWGTLNMGRLDSDTPTGSPLYSQAARNLRWIVHDAGVVAIGTRVLNGNNRVSNAVTYKTPDLGGFNAVARVNLAGPDGTTTTSNPALKSPDDFKQYQVALNYKNGPWGVGTGYGWDDKKGGFLTNDFKNKAQAVASYEAPSFKTYALLSQEQFNAAPGARSAVKVWLIGATVPFGVHRVTANFMQRDVQLDRAGKLKKFQADYSHSLSARSTLYVFVDRDVSNSHLPNTLATGLGVGMLHRF
ncbi:porin [Curvibacter sp. RS43]|uniref:porin n=1 Tax=Curvibacter microcysteis TaxID=3026419 RepID=UPI00235EACFA|nr:porin [Curvibacter sp. RS43]MDD0812931.1 porin [Curvibacter sp. RS43]